VTAVDGGRSVATSMGMTPLEGLMMGTRAGSIDPGIILQLLRSGRLTVDQLADALDHGSGLLGVSGRSVDVRELEKAEAAGDEGSALALELFVARAAAGIAAAATSLRALDAIVFTGGIGENSVSIRKRILGKLAVLNVGPIDGTAEDDRVVTVPDATPAVLRIAAREDVVIAEAVGGAVSPT
jgi:acetate kinase